MLLNTSLYKAFKNLQAKGTSREDLNYIISIASKVSKVYLSRNYSKVSRMYENFQMNQDEIAMDAVAGLFCTGKTGSNPHIVNAFASWEPEITNEAEAFYFVNKVVASAVEQYISEMLRDSDPVFSKIYNSVNYLIRKQGFIKKEFAGCRYIVKEDTQGIERDLICYDAFEAVPGTCFINKNTFLNDLFAYIGENHAPAIPVNHLVSRLKKLYMQMPSTYSEFPEEKIVLDEALKSAMLETEELMEQKYLKKGKLTEQQAECFRLALRDMMNDLRDGGINPGIGKYVEKYMPDFLNSSTYAVHHNILEYLLKMMKNSIVDKLNHL